MAVSNEHVEDYPYADGKLLVLAKTPVLQHVKTRLAADIGDEAALDVYKQLLETTLKTVVSSKLLPVELWLDTDQQNDWLEDLVDRYAVSVQQQSGSDLGERMADAICKTLKAAEFCILIGVDCPLLDVNYINSACIALQDGAEIVIGPAEDGGYVLVGMKNYKPELFTSIAWSTASVMQQTRQIMEQKKWQFEELAVLWDIDHLANYQRWIELRT
ncbi:MAG: TIGR04282 family arsenosugar biosynthesis glycosyltransferase [Gammaproteobacteria bacterium]